MKSIDNLWDFDVRHGTDVSPKQIMEAQAEYLKEMSQGAIQVNVQSSPGKGVRSDTYVYAFKVGTEAPMEFEYKLFEVCQPIDIYPLQVSSEPSQVAAECNNLDDFKSALKSILNAESTQRRLRALYSQATGDSVAAVGETGDREPAAVASVPQATDAQEPAADQAMDETSELSNEVRDASDETIAETAYDEMDTGDSRYDEGEVVSADMSVADFKNHFKLKFNGSGYDSIGEYMRAELGPGARTGARIEKSGAILEVNQTSGKHIIEVNVIRIQ